MYAEFTVLHASDEIEFVLNRVVARYLDSTWTWMAMSLFHLTEVVTFPLVKSTNAERLQLAAPVSFSALGAPMIECALNESTQANARPGFRLIELLASRAIL